MKSVLKRLTGIANPLLDRLRSAGADGLVRSGKLDEATQVIQRALRGAGLMPSESVQPGPTQPTRDAANGVIEGEFEVVSETTTGPTASGAQFPAGHFEADAGTRDYKLFVPAGYVGQRLPLLLMLHGCTQDPDDFARGTRMNQLAQEQGFIVLYPAQAPRSNANKCWNWFVPADQQRGQGEPALLAALTRQIVATQNVDPARVYAAGLSAGGAMAAILGREYPDVYAAVGVHSGLAPGAARDIPSAFAAMKKAPPASEVRRGAPVIVFHGDQDHTVHHDNGRRVLEAQGLGTASSNESGIAGRAFDREIHRDSSGRIEAEFWRVHGAGHAWSGGSADGSYTDPKGPDASREMLRFFLEHGVDPSRATP